MNHRARLLLLALATLAACDAKAKTTPADPCALAVDHGIKLIETELRSGQPFPEELCGDAAAEQLRCTTDARTSDDLLACARAALTAPITIHPRDHVVPAEQRAACAAANDNWLRVNLDVIVTARASQIDACAASKAAHVPCQLAATDPAAWLACTSPAE